jgi:CRISPR-associated endonuclease/helicase Cas3
MPAIPFKQSFLSAGKIFNVIDSFTRGVIIPYGDRGKQLIADLCGALPLEKQYRTLKEAQRYSVNLYQHELDELVKQDAIREVKQDSGVYCLDERYYSAEIGWCAEAVNPMSTLCF